jgi:GMP synthase-like glutamine amidotransferase
MQVRNAMRAVLVIEHTEGDGPGHFGDWLAANGRPMHLVRVHAGDPVPLAIGDHAGLCVLGGPMSANDVHLAHIRDELVLVRDAIERRVPMIGHCLGGQLLAKTLGATIAASPEPEIGWHAIGVADNDAAHRWFGEVRAPVVMQWHYEAFSLPPGAIGLAGNPSCPHQAFEWGGIHLGMQFHPEADASKLAGWLEKDRAEAESMKGVPTIQTPGHIAAGIGVHLPAMRRLAYRLYDVWSTALWH